MAGNVHVHAPPLGILAQLVPYRGADACNLSFFSSTAGEIRRKLWEFVRIVMVYGGEFGLDF